MNLWPFKRGEKTATEIEPTTTHRREPSLLRRSYRAAKPDRLAAGFKIFSTTTRDETRREIRGLVGHSRHAAHNFDFQRSYEMLFRRHVIGANGIRLQMNVRWPDGRKDTVANRAIEAGWQKWGKKGSPSICGQLSWWGIECQVATAIAREGGAFMRFHEGRGRGAFGFQVEPIPFDLLDVDLTQRVSENSYIESGIEFNQDGRVLAFHLWSVPLSEGHRPTRRQRIRVPAREMIYVTIPEEIGQSLGVPRSATALRLMNLSEKFQESAMAAANYGAAQMVFFEQENTSGQIGGDANTEVPIDEVEAGTMAMLPPGVKAVPHIPHYPDAAVEPFMRHMGTNQAAGLGVAYETLSGDLSRANFSSLRAGKGEERDEWRMLQRAIFEGLHDLVFARWLPLAVISGQLRLPFSKMDKFLAAIWRPRGWPSVNPKDDATANSNDLASGAKSLTEIVAEKGRSIEDVLDERAAEVAMFKERGLPVPAWAGLPDDDLPGDTEPPPKEAK
ncbi:phage portal protein [Falsiruegeria litorea]|uniref:phage portal protein n=1 Tax=Falsiruegeria litorea TaxID=1280831 RepID=UPI001BFD298F|nr:phage portal protein [Falsiruegeria litorea]MBT8169880.1 phage portal protein [Falsiruegeria litorea]